MLLPSEFFTHDTHTQHSFWFVHSRCSFARFPRTQHLIRQVSSAAPLGCFSSIVVISFCSFNFCFSAPVFGINFCFILLLFCCSSKRPFIRCFCFWSSLFDQNLFFFFRNLVFRFSKGSLCFCDLLLHSSAHSNFCHHLQRVWHLWYWSEGFFYLVEISSWVCL